MRDSYAESPEPSGVNTRSLPKGRREGAQCYPRSGRAWGRSTGTVRCQCVWRTRPLQTGTGSGGEAGEVAQGQDVEGLEHLSKVTAQGF